jgi:hypothetical protein
MGELAQLERGIEQTHPHIFVGVRFLRPYHFVQAIAQIMCCRPRPAWLAVNLNVSAIVNNEKGGIDSERIERESLLAMNPSSEMNIDKVAPASNSARLPMGKHSDSSISRRWLNS